MAIFSASLDTILARHWRPSEWAAWLLLTIWAGVWIVFNIVAGIGEMVELGVTAVAGHAVVPLLIVIVLFLCWRWQMVGATAAVFVSFICILWYGFEHWYVVALLDAPPLLAGMLFAVTWVRYSEEPKLGQ